MRAVQGETAGVETRPSPVPFPYWAQLGNRGWGWDDVLPYFKRAEAWRARRVNCMAAAGSSRPRQ